MQRREAMPLLPLVLAPAYCPRLLSHVPLPMAECDELSAIEFMNITSNARMGRAISLPLLAASLMWPAMNGASNDQQTAQRSREERFVDSVLARLTLEEKLGQLNQVSGLGNPTGGTSAKPAPRGKYSNRNRFR